MPRVLLTAFKPYDQWQSNASWLAVMELTRSLPASPHLTTRLYPVDFVAVREHLARDLADNYDYALHIGQAPGSSRVQFEAFALNIGGEPRELADRHLPLVVDGPPAYAATLPLADWAERVRGAGIPAGVSYHAGTYLCNAVYYLSRHLCTTLSLRTESAFVHVPLDVTQTVGVSRDLPSLPTPLTAQALRIVLEELR